MTFPMFGACKHRRAEIDSNDGGVGRIKRKILAGADASVDPTTLKTATL